MASFAFNSTLRGNEEAFGSAPDAAWELKRFPFMTDVKMRIVRRADLRPGDEVLFVFGGEQVEIDGETRLLAGRGDVLGVLDGIDRPASEVEWLRTK